MPCRVLISQCDHEILLPQKMTSAISSPSFSRTYSQGHDLRSHLEIETVTNSVLFVAGQKEP